MTTTMGASVTPGQKCLLDLLQRKLLSTIQAYSKLSRESQQSDTSRQEAIESELNKLRDKIRRISARQKRFTLEIINGNGNNTIPKETFFQALGLITKEALSKLNSKSNERRRRTTANPRFSHEAIQAKRALEPLHKRQLDQRTRDSKREASRRPQKSNNNSSTNNNNNNNNNNTNKSSNFSTTNQQASSESSHNVNSNSKASSYPTNSSNKKINSNTCGGTNNQQNLTSNNNNAISNSRSTNNTSANTNTNTNTAHFNHSHNDNQPHQTNKETSNQTILQKERNELLNQYGILQMHINKRVNQIVDKRESNRHLEKQIELMKKRGLDLVTAIHLIDPTVKFLDDGQLISNPSDIKNDQTTISNQAEQNSKVSHHKAQQKQPERGVQRGAGQYSNAEPLDIYIDMKCDESLDGLD